MKTKQVLTFILLFGIGFSACKSAYEQTRTSNDPPRILKEANALYDQGEFTKAQGLYDLIIPFYRGKQEAADLFYRYTYTHYNLGQYILAAHYFNSFSKTFYNSPKKEEMAFMSAYSNYKLSPNYKLDQTPSVKAIDELQSYINQYPNSDRVEECNALMDELRGKLEKKAFEQGKLYYNLKNYQSAMAAFEDTIKDFPETSRAEEIKYYIVQSSEQLARNSIYEKMEERLLDTIEKCERFEKKYPKSDKKRELKAIKDFCNKELKRFVND